MDFRQVETGPATLLRYAQLLHTCFPGAVTFRTDYLAWLYDGIEVPQAKR